MKLLYHNDFNFGDALNPILFDSLLPGVFDSDPETAFLGIGTLMGILPLPDNCRRGFIFSSGSGYEKPAALDARWKVLCVRGPLTARAYGLNEDLAITDGAVLADRLASGEEKSYPCSYIPHHYSLDKYDDWEGVCSDADVHFINPVVSAGNSVTDIIREIMRSEMIIAEALHGAILADSLRIPWIPVRAYDHINLFKWQDYGASVGLHFEQTKLPSIYSPQFLKRKLAEKTGLGYSAAQPVLAAAGNLFYNNPKSEVVDRLAGVRRLGNPVLSADEIMRDRKDQLYECLERFGS